MASIIVAAHGKSAPELCATAQMILGTFNHVTAVEFHPGQGPEDLIAEYQKIADTRPADEEILLLVDLFGGSPYNAGARFAAERPNTAVVAGVNIPMLLEVISGMGRATATLTSLVATAEKAGTRGIRSFQASTNPPQAPAPAEQTKPDTLHTLTQPPEPAPATGADGHMDVVFLRIDSRLIHGQVAGAWSNHVAPQTLIAASDSAAHDTLRKTLLLQVAPPHIKTNVLDIAKTGRVYNNPKYTGMKTMIVVETPQAALELLDAGVKISEINVGGVTYKDGMKRVSEAVYASEDDLKTYQELNRRGITMTIQQVPNSGREDMMKKLKEKGLIA